MACDLCGKTGVSLNTMRDCYKVEGVESICGGCETIVNRKLFKMREVADGMVRTLFKRFLREKKERATASVRAVPSASDEAQRGGSK
jgi:hypothetical protein